MKHPPTAEQSKILSAFKESDEAIMAIAAAGAGKTSTLVMLAEDNPDTKFLYIVFNRRNKIEARSMFPKNVVIHTVHSLAFQLMNMKDYPDKCDFDRRQDYFSIFKKIKSKIKKGDTTYAPLKDSAILKVMRESVSRFENSVGQGIELEDMEAVYYDPLLFGALLVKHSKQVIDQNQEMILKHLGAVSPNYNAEYLESFQKKYAESVQDASRSSLDFLQRLPKSFLKSLNEVIMQIENSDAEVKAVKDYIAYLHRLTEKFWLRLSDLSNDIVLGHDTYLKLLQLSDSNLTGYDCILWDEYQDANPVMLDIVMRQWADVRKFFVGDHHQSIYQFRGAVNAIPELLKKSDVKTCHLSTSFRFGETIAEIANNVIKSKNRLVRRYKAVAGVSIKGFKENIADEGTPQTILCRTNAGVIDQALKYGFNGNRRVNLSDSIDVYFMDKLKDICYLLLGRREDIKSDLIKGYEDRKELTEEASLKGDADTLRAVKICENIIGDFDYKEVFSYLDSMLDSSEDSFDFEIMTAHKSKGLERMRIHIADDFAKAFYKLNPDGSISSERKKIVPESEINLLYVAVTRAQAEISADPMMAEVIGIEPKEKDIEMSDDQEAEEGEQASASALG